MGSIFTQVPKSLTIQIDKTQEMRKFDARCRDEHLLQERKVRIWFNRREQCDQIKRFLKLICYTFSLRSSQTFYFFLGNFKKVTFQVKPAVANFWPNIETFGILFMPTSGHTDRLGER